MQFETFEARLLTLKKASKGDLKEYELQLQAYHVSNGLEIVNSLDVQYITIFDKRDKMVGLIEIDEIEEKVAYMKISIPNECKVMKFGREAVDQFIKCCKQRELYKKIYFNDEDRIINMFRYERPNLFENSSLFVDLSIA